MEIVNSTPAQNSWISFLCRSLKIDKETRAELLYVQTDGRTDDFEGLLKHEADAIIKLLTGDKKGQQNPAAKMRRKILSMGHELGWKTPGGKIDMERINAWCNKYGHVKRDLDKYTENELPELVTQFEAAYITHIKKV